MQLRKIAIICSIAGFLYSGLAVALGLGEITLKSEFNQPLVAEIRLLKVRNLSEDEILISLASQEAFQGAGVDRLFFLTDLRFNVVLNNPENPHIKVTSRKPVIEPYLDFLVEMQWPSGRLLREYTLLLDLPVFNEGKSASTASVPRASAPPTYSQSRPVARPLEPEVKKPTPAEPRSLPQPATTSRFTSSQAVDSYRVRSGDTLWEIAEQVRPNGSLTVTQTMIAIQESNPDAFINNNINLLRNGRVLRIPSREQIAQIDYDEALISVREQTQSWSNTSKAVLTSETPSEGSSQNTTQPEGRLTLGSQGNGAGQASGSIAGGRGEALQNELSEAQEELSRAQRENSELRSRVVELESQIQTMDALVNVTNTQLKALQAAIQAEQQSESGLGAVEASVDGTQSLAAVQDEQSSATEEPDGQLMTAGPIDSGLPREPIAQAQPEPPKPVPVAPTPVSTPVKVSYLDVIKQNIYFVGGGVLLLIVLVLFLMRLREGSEEDVEIDTEEFDFDEEENDLFAGSDEVGQEEFDSSELFAELSAASEGIDESIEAQTEDVVAESDIYLGLGQEDKAIGLLQKEIHQNPDNAEARLGLLNIYAKMQNAAAFDEQYAQLLPLGDSDKNNQAAALRNEIQGVDPFDIDQYSPSAVSEFESELDQGLNELDATEQEDTTVVNSDKDPGDEFEDLDLDLDLDLEGDDAFNFELDDDQQETAGDLGLLDGELDGLSVGDLDAELDGLGELGDLDAELGELSDLDAELDGLGELGDLDAELGELSDLDAELDGLGELSDLDTELDGLGELSDLDAELDGLGELGDLDAELDGLGELVDDLDEELDSLEGAEEVSLGDNLDLDGLGSAPSELDDDTTGELDADIDAGLEVLETSDLESTLDSDLDLDGPPDDIDIASLDKEIDVMTAGLDQDLEGDINDNGPMGSADIPESISDNADELEVSVGDMSFLEASDEVATKLDLAKAYLDIGDNEGAKSILDEVVQEGSPEQKDEALMLSSEIVNYVSDEADLGINANEKVEELLEEVGDLAQLEDKVLTGPSADEAEVTVDDDLDFLETSDEVATKLDLAKAYLDMGDREGAEDILDEVLQEGSSDQKGEAQELMRDI